MKIVLGVTGSISAYKACDIVSGLVNTHHDSESVGSWDVLVVMTDAAKMFIPAMPLATLSQKPVISDFMEEQNGKVLHIEISEWAQVLLIAPATANTIASIAGGIANNQLTAIALAFDKHHRVICPAMNSHMYENPATQHNLDVLKERGWMVIEPVKGVLACGAVGVGKLPKPRKIVEIINKIT